MTTSVSEEILTLIETYGDAREQCARYAERAQLQLQMASNPMAHDIFLGKASEMLQQANETMQEIEQRLSVLVKEK
jgi:hypothetical protein